MTDRLIRRGVEANLGGVVVAASVPTAAQVSLAPRVAFLAVQRQSNGDGQVGGRADCLRQPLLLLLLRVTCEMLFLI